MIPRCDEIRESLAGGSTAEHVREHLASCDACRAHAEQLERIRAAVQVTAARGLDDVARRRIQSRLGEALDREAERRAGVGRRTWQWAAAAAAVALVLGVVVGRQRWRQPPAPGATTMALETLVPYSAAGMDERAASRLLLGAHRRELEVPAQAVVRAVVATTPGARAGKIALVGPGRVVVQQATATQLELRLERGLLLADVEHVEGRSFRVVAPGATVTVVGTLFAVDARDPLRARVAVSRGAVVVRAAPSLVALSAGQSWRVGDRQPSGIAAPLEALLAEHAAQVPPRSGRLGVLSLQGTPVGAQAALEATPLGRTPLAVLLPAEVAGVTLSASRHASTTVRVNVVAGQTTRLGFALSPLPTTQPEVAPATNPASTATTRRARSRESAETLYGWAESALRSGDEALARRVLRELVRRFPRDPAVASARYELARLAHRAGAIDEARLHLRELVRGREPTFHDPARYLLCRISAEARRTDEAQTCLQVFRRDFPSSPHDHEALFLLAQIAELRGGCAAAKPLFDEYLRRYPSATFASRAKQRSARCAR
jgi:TolA-binding protein/ferric-dicitrate binding protein FerR (iron transport regulator)